LIEHVAVTGFPNQSRAPAKLSKPKPLTDAGLKQVANGNPDFAGLDARLLSAGVNPHAASAVRTPKFHAYELLKKRNFCPPSGRGNFVAVNPDKFGPTTDKSGRTGRTFHTPGCVIFGLTHARD
jgi:hypothetical protein